MPNDDIMWLIARYLNGEASALERQALQQWADQSPDNARYLQEMEVIWCTKPSEKPIFDSHMAFSKLKLVR
jgi:ferric-dicitrate binding protein FerR (iron transport regulator)